MIWCWNEALKMDRRGNGSGFGPDCGRGGDYRLDRGIVMIDNQQAIIDALASGPATLTELWRKTDIRGPQNIVVALEQLKGQGLVLRVDGWPTKYELVEAKDNNETIITV
jgi:hypothetical protein